MLMNNLTKERHIAFICDDNYVMPTTVAIYSLVENLETTDYQYFIHICTFGLNKDNTDFFNSLVFNNVKIIVHSFNIKDYRDKFDKINQTTHVSPAALIKFDLSKIFTNINELLYLDSDIIVKKDISILFEIDVTNHYIAASFEFWKYLLETYKSKNCPIPSFYFNSGVMLLNLQKMREDSISEQLWNTKINDFNSPEKKVQMMDQDTLNKVCGYKTLHLPIKYNLNCYFTKGIDIELINKVYVTKYSDCNELKNDAVIIHYVGKADKPWKYFGN